jgi:hypothetical protein
MPTTRRKAAAPTAASSQLSQQSTLSFNNKPTRVTKSNVVDTSKKSKLSESAEKQVVAITTPEPEQIVETEDLVIRASPSKTSTPKRKSKLKSDRFEDAREKAGEVSDAQIEKYWKAEEDSRLAPRGTPALPLSYTLLIGSQSTKKKSLYTRKSCATSTCAPNTAPASASHVCSGGTAPRDSAWIHQSKCSP